jgi:hypothetical protein
MGAQQMHVKKSCRLTFGGAALSMTVRLRHWLALVERWFTECRFVTSRSKAPKRQQKDSSAADIRWNDIEDTHYPNLQSGTRFASSCRFVSHAPRQSGLEL